MGQYTRYNVGCNGCPDAFQTGKLPENVERLATEQYVPIVKATEHGGWVGPSVLAMYCDARERCPNGVETLAEMAVEDGATIITEGDSDWDAHLNRVSH